ncbi:MAG: calcium:proton exchanger [Chlamydiae bacterium CG10_big_fil_rev_8_21_14_0_10_42_34]|nr:MAG: calcium:proton exchanger [Chlamydiae bacterium CG10_big_fil_rev_8_21_14_0_10_42_34]
MTVFYLILGVFLLYVGSEALVRGGTSLSLRFRIKPLIIGLTVIAFGTSSPELFVSVKATLAGHGNISAGDIVGSSIFNIAGILSFCALFGAIPLKKQLIKFDLPVMFLGYVLLSYFFLTGMVPRWAGVMLICLLILYLLAIYLIPKRRLLQEKEIEDEIGRPLKNVFWDLIYIFGGLAALIYGSQEIISSAIHIAKEMGINEGKVSLGIVAIGTSLPEVSCCLVALWYKRYDILVGNLIGSNVFNVFSVIGCAATISPIEVNQISYIDLSMMFFSGAFVFPLLQEEAKYPRFKGATLLAVYIAYFSHLIFST